MILIVDSGSTKTDWIAIENTGKVLFETQTLGLNPQVLSSNILKERIVNNFELYKFRKEIDKRCFSEPTIKKKRKIPYLIDQHKLESKDA